VILTFPALTAATTVFYWKCVKIHLCALPSAELGRQCAFGSGDEAAPGVDVETALKLATPPPHGPDATVTKRRSRDAFYRQLVWVVDGTRRKRDAAQFARAWSDGTPVGKGFLYSGWTRMTAHCCVSGQLALRQSSLILAMARHSGGFWLVA
jgi:hypothetical protein